MNTSQLWKLEGEYFEACNCESICPCIFLADPSHGDCTLTVAWHIEKGSFGPTRLDGLNVAGIYYTPGNMVTGPKWKAALYIDDRATQEQANALSQIYSGQAGGFLANLAALVGEVMGVSNTSIQFEVNGKQRRLRIPATLELETEGVTGSDPNLEPAISNPALYGAAGFNPKVARAAHYTLSDHGMEWNNSGKNAFYSRFAYSA